MRTHGSPSRRRHDPASTPSYQCERMDCRQRWARRDGAAAGAGEEALEIVNRHSVAHRVLCPAQKHRDVIGHVEIGAPAAAIRLFFDLIEPGADLEVVSGRNLVGQPGPLRQCPALLEQRLEGGSLALGGRLRSPAISQLNHANQRGPTARGDDRPRARRFAKDGGRETDDLRRSGIPTVREYGAFRHSTGARPDRRRASRAGRRRSCASG